MPCGRHFIFLRSALFGGLGVFSRFFQAALDADGWGQAIEASDGYTDLLQLIDKQSPSLGLDADDTVCGRGACALFGSAGRWA